MNPIKETWEWLGQSIWSRKVFGSQRKRAIEAEAQMRLLEKQVLVNVSLSYKNGWRDGWDEAVKIAGIQFQGFDWPKDTE